MTRLNFSALAKVFFKPLLNVCIFVIFISTCSKAPTEGSGNNAGGGDNSNSTQGFSLYHEISYGEQISNDIIVKTDTITAFLTHEGVPAIEKYVVFNRINNAEGTLTPTSTLSDSMGMAKSIYSLTYSEYVDNIIFDVTDTVSIDIGVGNDVNSIVIHDTVNITYEQKAIEWG